MIVVAAVIAAFLLGLVLGVILGVMAFCERDDRRAEVIDLTGMRRK